MSLHVELPFEIEQSLRHQADQAGMDLSSFISELVKQKVAHQSDIDPSCANRVSGNEFVSRLSSLIQIHPQSGRVDEGRESIYAGRGE